MVDTVCNALKSVTRSLQNLMMPRALPAGEAVYGDDRDAAGMEGVSIEPRTLLRELTEGLPPDQITVNGELRLSTSGEALVALRSGEGCPAEEVRKIMLALELLELTDAVTLKEKSTIASLARHVKEGAPLNEADALTLERFGLAHTERSLGWTTPRSPLVMPMPSVSRSARLDDAVVATVRAGVVCGEEGRAVLVNPERRKLDDAHEAIRAEIGVSIELTKRQLPLDRVLKGEEAPLLSATGSTPITLKNGERFPADQVRDTMLRLELLCGANLLLFGGLYDYVKRQAPLSEGDVALLDAFGFGTSFQSATPGPSGHSSGIELAPPVRAVVLSGLIPVRDELWLTNPERREHPRRRASSTRS